MKESYRKLMDVKDKYQGLKFEEKEHKYKYNGKDLKPVSNVVHEFVETFDTDFHATRIAEKQGLTPEEVKKKWKSISDQACDFGTSVHKYAEDLVNYLYFGHIGSTSANYGPKNNHEAGVYNFWMELNPKYLPVALELQMFSEEFEYAGTCDVLLFDSELNGFVLLDYKTNKDLYKNFNGKMMLPPFEYMLDMPLNHYQLQLSLYQILLEEKGYKVVDRIVLWLEGAKTHTIHTHDFTSMLKKAISC